MLVASADLFLGVIVLVGLLSMIAIDITGAFRTYQPFVEVQHERGRVSGIAHESIDGALTIKALGRRAEETERFTEASNTLRDELIHVNSVWVGYRSVVESIPTIITLARLIKSSHPILGAVITDLGRTTVGGKSNTMLFDMGNQGSYATRLGVLALDGVMR